MWEPVPSGKEPLCSGKQTLSEPAFSIGGTQEPTGVRVSMDIEARPATVMSARYLCSGHVHQTDTAAGERLKVVCERSVSLPGRYDMMAHQIQSHSHIHSTKCFELPPCSDPVSASVTTAQIKQTQTQPSRNLEFSEGDRKSIK